MKNQGLSWFEIARRDSHTERERERRDQREIEGRERGTTRPAAFSWMERLWTQPS